MRLRNIPGARQTIAESEWIVQDPPQHKGHWRELYNDRKILHLEIGTGKGRFINRLAALNPTIAYIGIEKYSSVLIRALDKLEEAGLDNLLFIRGDAELVCEFFEEGEIDRIYLNFSDPWPKPRHAKRRLTSPSFLYKFSEALTEGGKLEFKTDNADLFTYSLEQFDLSPCFEIEAFTRDLHADEEMNQGNIMTEYEEKFSERGTAICKLIAVKK